MVSFKRLHCPRDLVRAREPTPTVPNKNSLETIGFFPCKSSKCILHKYIHFTNKFKAHRQIKECPVTTYINCSISSVTDLITCTHCGKQYDGKTETHYTRFSNTRSEISNFHDNTYTKFLPYTIHFNSTDHTLGNV